MSHRRFRRLFPGGQGDRGDCRDNGDRANSRPAPASMSRKDRKNRRRRLHRRRNHSTAGVDFQIGADDGNAANLAAAITEAGLGTATVAGAVVTVTRPSDELNSLVAQYNDPTQLTELAEDSGYKGKTVNDDDLS